MGVSMESKENIPGLRNSNSNEKDQKKTGKKDGKKKDKTPYGRGDKDRD
jgi:hypothetical protein